MRKEEKTKKEKSVPLKGNPFSLRISGYQGDSLNYWISIIFVFLIVFMMNYFGYRYYVRKDFSQEGYYNLSEKTLNVFKALKSPATITMFFGTLPKGELLRGQIETLLEEYKLRSEGKIKIKFVDRVLNEKEAQAIIAKYKLRLDEKEDNIVIIEYQGRNKSLSALESLFVWDEEGLVYGQKPRVKAFCGEQKITTVLQELLEGKKFKVYFLEGHGERDLKDEISEGGYGNLKNALIRENLDPQELNLLEKGRVPEDAAILVVAAPQMPISKEEIKMLEAFLKEKGKMIVMLEPPLPHSGLENMLKKYQIVFNRDIVMRNVSMLGMVEMLSSTALVTSFSDHPSVKKMKGYTLTLPSCASLQRIAPNKNIRPGEKLVEIIKTSAMFWGETNMTEPESTFNAKEDHVGPLTLGMLYDSGDLTKLDSSASNSYAPGIRLVAIGSSFFLTNKYLNEYGLSFFNGIVNWMLDREEITGIAPKASKEFPLLLTQFQLAWFFVLATLSIPLFALFLGFIVWFSRRK